MPEKPKKDVEAERRLKLGKKLLKACSKYEQDMKVIRELVEQEARVDVPSAWDGRTPLVLAIGRRNLELVALLLPRGADPNQMFNTGNRYESLLHISVAMGNLDVTKLLVKYGARISVDDLAVAIEGRNIKYVEFLLAAGVPDLEANGREVSGVYALQCARKSGEPEITRLITEELAKREKKRKEDALPGGRDQRIAELERALAENARTMTELRSEIEELRRPKGSVLVNIKLPLPPRPPGK